jgi:hypothetical protein
LIEYSPASIFWNPAGLADFENTKMQVDLETPFQVNNAMVVWNHPQLHFGKYPFNLGFAVINRLRVKGESDEIWSGYAAHILDLTMIDVDNFKGKIDSKTYDFRISIASRITERFQVGLTFLRLD